MTHSVKHTPAGPMCGARVGEGRYFKRAKAKTERALAKRALALGQDANFVFTPPVTYDIGDGKTYNCYADAKYMRK